MQLDRILPAFTLSLLAASLTFAQGAAPTPAPAAANAPSKGFTATVSADNVYLRSGPSKVSAYPFGKMKIGDVVEVEEESFGWAKVRTRGPAFGNTYAYVLANDKVTLSPDGKTLTAVSTTEVRAPNINADGNPDASTKAIGQLNAGETLTVVGQVNGEREKVHKVVMPPTSTGWIDMNFLRRATSGEAQAVANAPSVPAQGTPPVNAIEGGGTAIGESNPVPAPGGTVTVDPNAKSDKAATKAAAKAEKKAAQVEAAAEPKSVVEPAPRVKNEIEIAAEKRRTMHGDLEAIWVKVKAEPLGSSELTTLKDRYLILTNDPACEAEILALAKARVQQLDIQIEAQQRIQELKKLRAGIDADTEQLKAIKLAMEARSDYTVVGVLNASTVYDGVRLPLLFRLTDPAAGQTVAYVAAKDPNMLTTMLGTLIGIRGTKRFDEALKVNIVDPGTIDILTIRKEKQVQPTDAPAAKPAN
jgi:SH3-like domain-containing protein